VSLGIFEEKKEDQAKVNIIFIRNEADLARTLSAIPILVSPLLLTTGVVLVKSVRDGSENNNAAQKGPLHEIRSNLKSS
jgi:hypothetical protein